jgi:hypothetical protein
MPAPDSRGGHDEQAFIFFSSFEVQIEPVAFCRLHQIADMTDSNLLE